jgi:Nucleotidyl transferase AbiEii toxin, Type IV TA system
VVLSKPLGNVNRQLPFLNALCWQVSDVEQLTQVEILQTYERGWRHLGILTQPSDEEWQFIRDLSHQYKSWLQADLDRNASPLMKHQWHESILFILQSLDREFLQEAGIYFGGGTLISLMCNEHRLSQDIDFLTTSNGYRQLRRSIADNGYDALFKSTDGIQFPRSIQADGYGIRFPIEIENNTIKFEVIAEGRIELAAPNYPDWSPVPCLALVDCWAEKLLANTDRWADEGTRSRDLIDLSALRLESSLLTIATLKAETAYQVKSSLTKALGKFQTNSDWRYRCYQSLEIDRPDLIIDGIDLLAEDLGLPPTVRIFSEMSK